jgi:hypothetical protein
MSQSDLELQHGQASAVLSNIQRKCSGMALTFIISFVDHTTALLRGKHSPDMLSLCLLVSLTTLSLLCRFPASDGIMSMMVFLVVTLCGLVGRYQIKSHEWEDEKDADVTLS